MTKSKRCSTGREGEADRGSEGRSRQRGPIEAARADRPIEVDVALPAMGQRQIEAGRRVCICLERQRAKSSFCLRHARQRKAHSVLAICTSPPPALKEPEGLTSPRATASGTSGLLTCDMVESPTIPNEKPRSSQPPVSLPHTGPEQHLMPKPTSSQEPCLPQDSDSEATLQAAAGRPTNVCTFCPRHWQQQPIAQPA